LVVLGVSAGNQRTVSISGLLKAPQAWNGANISVVGYYRTGGHSSYLCKDARSAETGEGTEKIFVDLPNWVSERRAQSALGRFVRISGTFQYMRRYKTDVSTKPDDPKRRTLIETTSAFGWMGLYDKQLTKITEFKPVP
jgi:hypothetical protein